MNQFEQVENHYGNDGDSNYSNTAPYKRLFASKLLLHIKDYTEYLRAIRSKRQKTGRLEGRKAQNWIYSESDEPASFRWCCEILGLNPDVVRSRVELNWREI